MKNSPATARTAAPAGWKKSNSTIRMGALGHTPRKLPPSPPLSTIRLAQADTLPHIGLDTTGVAVTIDLGDPSAPAGDVHSRNKEQVAERLALAALHVVYVMLL